MWGSKVHSHCILPPYLWLLAIVSVILGGAVVRGDSNAVRVKDDIVFGGLVVRDGSVLSGQERVCSSSR